MNEIDDKILNQYLSFIMDNELYGINVQNIREVLSVPHITRVPGMPEFVSGFFNLRGNVVPAIDLQCKFGLGKTEITPETNIIVVETEPVVSEQGDAESQKLVMGIFSDLVQKVITFEQESISPAPTVGTAIDTSFLIGIGNFEGNFIMLLDLEHCLMHNEELRTLAKAQAADTETAEKLIPVTEG